MPRFRQYIICIKRYGAIAMHHSCGAVSDLIPDMIERRLDVLQSIQPEASGMNIKELSEKFGSNISFHGGISIQKTMPFGSPDEVKNEVAKVSELFRDRVGYIFFFCTAHNIQADTPVKNIIALMEAYHEFGISGQ